MSGAKSASHGAIAGIDAELLGRETIGSLTIAISEL
jgi:hypothetical protein